MSLSPETRFGPYEILAPIGAGGMGEVYHARDTKLDRDVAVKVLPEALSKDKERLARFEREAKLLAQINHANIATLHGLEESAGRKFLVMELVEGETLAEQISRGPIQPDEAQHLFVQIAEGLEAAHEKGIIHRDLKPANIKITPDGKVKILDFGLAKAFTANEDVSAETSQSPTMTKGTALGTIMGTASYMSPEQARGKPVDKRTDIWAFGCCLYEALTGKKAFAGETVTDTISAVVRAEPDWNPLTKHPPHLRRLLARCLQKDRRERIHDIGDARIELGDVPDELEPSIEQRAALTMGLAIAAVAVVVVCILIGWFMGARTRSPLPQARGSATHGVIELPTEASLALGTRVPLLGFDGLALALSPDGSVLVYVGQTDGGTQLYRRAMNELEVTAIPGTEGAIHPFFSPDGEWVGFLTTDQVKKVSLQGGASVTLADARTPTRGSWATNGMVYLAEKEGRRLTRIPAAGGTPSEVVDLSGLDARLNQVLSDGRSALLTSFSRGISADYADVLHISLETLETKVLIELGYDARYISSGHILFARSGNLLAVPFDINRLEVTGEPVSVVAGVAMDSFFAHAQFTFSDNGSLVYVPGVDASVGKLAWVDRRGNTELLPVPERLYGVVDLAPDGRRLAVHVADVNDYVWIYDIPRQEGRKLPTRTSAGWPRWTPDGSRVAYVTARPGKVFVQEVDGRNAPQELPTTPGAGAPNSWTSDGQILVTSRWLENKLEFLSRRNEGAPERSPAGWAGVFSPDDRWLAFVSDETGQFEVWARSFPEGDTVHQISVDYGIEPIWCQECDVLFYRKGNQWMASTVSLSPELSWEPPRVVFRTDFIDTPGVSYDVTPDGQRLLVVKRTREPERAKLNVVVNWFDELKRLVPTEN